MCQSVVLVGCIFRIMRLFPFYLIEPKVNFGYFAIRQIMHVMASQLCCFDMSTSIAPRQQIVASHRELFPCEQSGFSFRDLENPVLRFGTSVLFWGRVPSFPFSLARIGCWLSRIIFQLYVRDEKS